MRAGVWCCACVASSPVDALIFTVEAKAAFQWYDMPAIVHFYDADNPALFPAPYSSTPGPGVHGADADSEACIAQRLGFTLAPLKV